MVRRPIRAAVRRTRRAISPRFATSSESNTSSDTSAMGLAIVVLAAAVALAAALGGRWHRLAHLQLRSRGLIVAAVVRAGRRCLDRHRRVRRRRARPMSAASWSARPARCGSAPATCGCPGVALVSAGLVANAAVVALNGAMPVSIVAAYHARVPIGAISAGTDARHEIAGIGTRLALARRRRPGPAAAAPGGGQPRRRARRRRPRRAGGDGHDGISTAPEGVHPWRRRRASVGRVRRARPTTAVVRTHNTSIDCDVVAGFSRASGTADVTVNG